MRAGRPRKAKAAHETAGTYRPDRHKDDDLAVVGGLPRRPDWIKGDARHFWNALVRAVAPGVLTRADFFIMCGAAKWWQNWRTCQKNLEAKKGDDYRALNMTTAAWKQLDGCLTKLGLSPVERARLADLIGSGLTVPGEELPDAAQIIQMMKAE